MEAGASSAEGSFLVAAQGPDVWWGEMGQVLMVCTDRAVTLTPGSIVTSGIVFFQNVCACVPMTLGPILHSILGRGCASLWLCRGLTFGGKGVFGSMHLCLECWRAGCHVWHQVCVQR